MFQGHLHKFSFFWSFQYYELFTILINRVPYFPRDNEVDTWRENSSVQPLTFTKETCLRLILLLAESTNTIAPSLRDMNGFKVR